VRLAEARGQEYFHRLPPQLAGADAEEGFGPTVDCYNDAGPIHQQHGVG
jgi:hypothetical protein